MLSSNILFIYLIEHVHVHLHIYSMLNVQLIEHILYFFFPILRFFFAIDFYLLKNISIFQEYCSK